MKLQFAKYPDDGKINSNQAGFHKITGCATSRWGLDLNLNYHKPSTRPIECQQPANVVDAEKYFGDRSLPQKSWLGLDCLRKSKFLVKISQLPFLSPCQVSSGKFWNCFDISQWKRKKKVLCDNWRPDQPSRQVDKPSGHNSFLPVLVKVALIPFSAILVAECTCMNHQFNLCGILGSHVIFS